MLMSSSRVRAIKLPGASTTSKFPEPASMCPASCVSVRSVRCDTNRTPLVTLSARIGPTNSPLIVKLPLAYHLDASAVSRNFHVALRVRNFGVAVAHIHAHVSARASHFDVAIAVVDADLRSHIGHAHVALFAMNGQQGLLRHRDIHLDADTRAPASDSRGTHVETVPILDDLRGHVLAHPLRSRLPLTLYRDCAGYTDFG